MIDYLIDILIALLDSISNILPVQFSGIGVNEFSNNFFRGFLYFQNTFNFIESFFPIALVFIFFAIMITMEILSSFVVRGVFWLIRTVRGG